MFEQTTPQSDCCWESVQCALSHREWGGAGVIAAACLAGQRVHEDSQEKTTWLLVQRL